MQLLNERGNDFWLLMVAVVAALAAVWFQMKRVDKNNPDLNIGLGRTGNSKPGLRLSYLGCYVIVYLVRCN